MFGENGRTSKSDSRRRALELRKRSVSSARCQRPRGYRRKPRSGERGGRIVNRAVALREEVALREKEGHSLSVYINLFPQQGFSTVRRTLPLPGIRCATARHPVRARRHPLTSPAYKSRMTRNLFPTPSCTRRAAPGSFPVRQGVRRLFRARARLARPGQTGGVHEPVDERIDRSVSGFVEHGNRHYPQGVPPDAGYAAAVIGFSANGAGGTEIALRIGRLHRRRASPMPATYELPEGATVWRPR